MVKPLKVLTVKAGYFLCMLLCVAVLAWSLTPSTGHNPVYLEVLTDHAEMMSEHGHSHSFAEDLWWALHGHHHDTVDHEHNLGVVLSPLQENTISVKRVRWRPLMVSTASSAPNIPRRPPRA